MNYLSSRRISLLQSVASVAAFTVATVPAHGQVAPPTTPAQDQAGSTATRGAAADLNTGLEEIIVTAQKREQNLQRVPVAVTALGTQALDDRRITNVAGLASIVPNFQVVQQPSNAALPAYSLRGVLGGETSYQVDNGVSVYVDGVYLGRSSGTLFDVADIARIEVLRGPQGTLFGRNTTGGAVNILTRTPPGEFGIKQDLSYGRFHDFRSRTRIDLPKLGPIAASVTYVHRENDGYVKNLSAGVTRDYTEGTEGRIGKQTAADTLGAGNVDAVFVAARYDDDSPLTADVKFDYTSFRGSQLGLQLIGLRSANDIPATNTLGGTYAFILSQQPALGGTNTISTKPLKAIHEPQRATDGLTSVGGSFTLNYEVADGITLKNIAAVRGLHQDSNGNSFDGNRLIDPFGGTGNDFTILDAISRRRQSQVSDELQVVGQTQRFNWVVGAFYFREKGRDYSDTMFFKTFPPEGDQVPILPADHFSQVRIRNASQALYAQATYSLTDTLRLTGGLRHTWDQRREINFLANPTTETNKSFSKLTYQGVIEYQVTPDAMVYGKVSTGYLSGGVYNGQAFQPESLRAYEIGAKVELFDRRLRINAAAFQSDYDDLQVSVFTTVLNYENVGKARIRGAELEVTAAPTRGLSLGANFGYLNFKYLRYISSLLTGTPQDISSFAVRPFTPKFTFAPYVGYDTQPMANGAHLSVQFNADYRSSMKFALSPFADPALEKAATSQARWIVNGRLSLIDLPVAGSKVRLSAWMDNMFDRRVVQYVSDVSGIVAGSFNKPRTFGIDASFEL